MQSSCILLVDGNLHGHVARRAALEDLGYAVETASSASQALELFEQHRFDLIVTDFRLSDFGGPALIARLREKSPRVPAIILSGYVATLGLTPVSTGADVLVTKGPNELKQLIHAIAGLLRPRARSVAGKGAMSTNRARRTRRSA